MFSILAPSLMYGKAYWQISVGALQFISIVFEISSPEKASIRPILAMPALLMRNRTSGRRSSKRGASFFTSISSLKSHSTGNTFFPKVLQISSSFF